LYTIEWNPIIITTPTGEDGTVEVSGMFGDIWHLLVRSLHVK